MNTPDDLPPGLTADAHWFHVLHAMFESGKVREMGSTAFSVYCAIKSHAAMRDGRSFPGQKRLGEMLGLTREAVGRAIGRLEAMGLVKTTRQDRNNVYTLVEHIPLLDSDGEGVATVQAQYVPMQFATLLADIKRAAAAGGPLTFNINFVTGANPTVHFHQQQPTEPAP